MSNEENYDDNKNNVQSKLNLAKDLNEILSTENAATVRIASRIDQTPIREVKRILNRHLNETNIQKNRLQKIIRRLGEEPTDAETDLSISFVSTTIPIENNFPENIKIKAEDNGLEHYLPEEFELVQMR
jgi:ferritin-like metal-binding protein YciE